ncbi:hypothetical protein DFH27DRAFT_612027 [Peziza echinospora]|nr:hypothetical protein DFH27DRAFT_612027 [Peziza echinospora]
MDEVLGNRPGVIDAVAKAYGITVDMDKTLFWTRGMDLLGDLLITASTHRMALLISDSKPTYRYSFDARNPFPGTEVSYTSHHAVDSYFLFQTTKFRMPTNIEKDVLTEHECSPM